MEFVKNDTGMTVFIRQKKIQKGNNKKEDHKRESNKKKGCKRESNKKKGCKKGKHGKKPPKKIAGKPQIRSRKKMQKNATEKHKKREKSGWNRNPTFPPDC